MIWTENQLQTAATANASRFALNLSECLLWLAHNTNDSRDRGHHQILGIQAICWPAATSAQLRAPSQH
jgi:hypothetical protein